MKALFICLAVILLVVAAKAVWVAVATRHHGDFESEKMDILARRDWLLSKVVTNPQKLIDEMPAIVGPQFQGEWALYSCSMLSAALVNTTLVYGEERDENIARIDSLIQIVMSPELRAYDRERWGEDPLETLDGNESHISYISHLAWMIGGYKHIGGGSKYDELYHKLCETMNRRILESPNMNLPTYPGECVYVPDMLVAIVALSVYSQQYDGKYYSAVCQWIDEAKRHWIDKDTEMLASFLPVESEGMYGETPIKGSYSALSCYYLTFVDKEFAPRAIREVEDELLAETTYHRLQGVPRQKVLAWDGHRRGSHRVQPQPDRYGFCRWKRDLFRGLGIATEAPEDRRACRNDMARQR